MADMDDLKKRTQEMLADLKQEYGELRVKANLGKKEAVDEWRELETKLAKLESKAKQLGGATAEASKDIGAAAKLLGEEIRNGIKRIAKRF
jgi:ribosomal protein L29